MFKEFRDFIMRGNVVDLAVGIVIGVAFGAIVSAFVDDILSPLLGLFGAPDFAQNTLVIGGATILYGAFIDSVVSFLLIALAVFFFVVKPMNRMAARNKAEAAPAVPTRDCPQCLSSIPAAAKRCAFCTSELTA